MKFLVSVVIPVLNEAEFIRGQFQDFLNRVPVNFQIIAVDGGSQDDTLNLLSSFSDNRLSVISSEKGRALQMNAGAAQADGGLLLFLHIDTHINESCLHALANIASASQNSSSSCWGRFDVELDSSGLNYDVLAWFINLRSRLTGISTGDQCIFVSRALFRSIGGYPQQQLMEDVELSKRLKTAGTKPMCLKNKVVTSARKWEKEGFVRTVLLMWSLRARYALGVSPEKLINSYYKSPPNNV